MPSNEKLLAAPNLSNPIACLIVYHPSIKTKISLTRFHFCLFYMKHTLLLLTTLCLFWGACKHDPLPTTTPTEGDWRTAEGQITGMDGRKCWCCSGYFLTTSDSTYLFSMPLDSGIDMENVVLPLPVRATFRPDTNYCWTATHRILVQSIEKR